LLLNGFDALEEDSARQAQQLLTTILP